MISDICDVFSPSGNESAMRNFVKEQLSDVFDDIKIDNIGNLVCKSGNGNRICVECGMDSCGIMLVSVADNKPRFAGIGGINAEFLIGKKIVFENKNFGIVRFDGKNAAESKISDLYLECDAAGLKVGDFGMVESCFCENETHIFANGLGNRIGLAAVLTAAKNAKKPQNMSIIFSAQKRLGSRGIQAFFSSNNFEKVITVDGAECKNAIKSGKGCTLIVADKAGVCRCDLAEDIKKEADKNDINLTNAVTEQDICMGYITTSGNGTKCGALAIPVENKNNSFESVSKYDFDETVKLLEKIIKDMD